jgi:hypothetical protein
MNAALCLDFGTSSIRAVYRSASGTAQVLDIGAVTDSRSIDGASIRSEVSIDSDHETVRFGERAYEAHLNGTRSIFREASPKLWLREPEKLSHSVIPGLAVTRRDLIVGLLAYALYAAAETGRWRVPRQLEDVDLRIAHPVWPREIRQRAEDALAQIGWHALHMASEGDWGETSIDVLQSWTSPDSGTSPRLAVPVDTLEPVAAAVELLPRSTNSRRICVVVDVGAGTTDLGVFHALSPDQSSGKASKLIPTGPTVSVFRAGDEIDRALLRILHERNPVAFRRSRVDIETRIRSLKEILFTQGRLFVGGIDLGLDALEDTNELRVMAVDIRDKLERCLSTARMAIEAWFSLGGGKVEPEIALVMAGGGAQLGFLRRKLMEPLVVGDHTYRFQIVEPKPPASLVTHGAGYARLAVALGGVNPLYDTVIHEHAEVMRIASLGKPKQVI